MVSGASTRLTICLCHLYLQPVEFAYMSVELASAPVELIVPCIDIGSQITIPARHCNDGGMRVLVADRLGSNAYTVVSEKASIHGSDRIDSILPNASDRAELLLIALLALSAIICLVQPACVQSGQRHMPHDSHCMNTRPFCQNRKARIDPNEFEGSLGEQRMMLRHARTTGELHFRIALFRIYKERAMASTMGQLDCFT